MSLASLEAFLEQAHTDQRLQELLCEAPDAAAVAAIAQAAGYPVSELDLWQASATSPDELGPAGEESVLAGDEPLNQISPPLPDPWLEEDPLRGFLHQAQGDEAIQQALSTAPDAAAVAAIAQAAGYPISELDLWQASAASPEELLEIPGEPVDSIPREEAEEFAPRTPWPGFRDEALLEFLHQAQGDEGLQQALATAPDAAAVAAIAQAAGYPISELDLWRASGIPAEELFPPEPDLSPLEAPLARFLLEAEHDPSLLEALAVAEDAAAVAAIAQAAGYPITTADLWEASDALPEELLISEVIVFAVEEELPN
jgi:predicted ribosomally synthesized peptide with nif11-like leader